MKNFFNLCPTISETSQKSIKLWWDISIACCIIMLLLLAAITCAQYIQIIRLKRACATLQLTVTDVQKEEQKLQQLVTRRNIYTECATALSQLSLKSAQLYNHLINLIPLMPARLKWTSYEYIQDKHIAISGTTDSPGVLAQYMKNLSATDYKNHELITIKNNSRNTQKYTFKIVVTPIF
ncbi:MAG: PilN domain-containing protein [Candidatus Babeliaceae bacterium]|jgi:hypothetical protein